MKVKGLLVLVVLCLLVATASGAMWSDRYGSSSVVLSDGSIVLTGGYNDIIYFNDVWRSTDGGSTWTEMTASAGWSARNAHSAVAMSDGSIILMGGSNNADLLTDVWRSTDNGATWTQMTANAGWPYRYSFGSVAFLDRIVVTGGTDAGGSALNDVWTSINNGATWTEVTASATWPARTEHSVVSPPDNSIILMGGYNAGGKNDVWTSTDNGSTWVETNAASAWSTRSGFASVILTDGSILVIGGGGAGGLLNDTWISHNSGVTWTQQNASSGWIARIYHNSVVLPDGSILVTGGLPSIEGGGLNDVWRSFDSGVTWSEPPWPEGEVIFTGYVNEAETALPISGAIVNITQGSSFSTTTVGAGGFYNTSGTLFVTGGSILFNVTAAGHTSYNVSTVPLFPKVVALNFTLNSTTPTYTGLAAGGVARDGVLTGNVITKGYGRPIQSATVYLVNNTNYEVHTKTTSMTGWYLCDEGSSCYLTSTRPYSIWGNKAGYRDSPEYIRSVAP